LQMQFGLTKADLLKTLEPAFAGYRIDSWCQSRDSAIIISMLC
jgi:hypothetical protein